ncbi:MAG: DNA-directed RNA polymerase subunit omega [Candidatus Zixiibacteriota bacterium]|jgi:DNA-directed RNA polymerase subunit K/omega
MVKDEQKTVEQVFTDSDNDYVTVLAIARRARQILDDYPKYEELLENEKATVLALEEYVGGKFTFEAGPALTQPQDTE